MLDAISLSVGPNLQFLRTDPKYNLILKLIS